MNFKPIVFVTGLAMGCASFGQGKEAFLQMQAYAEMQRVTGQMDVLQTNLGDLQRRVGALEGAGDNKGIRQEIEALKAAVADLRRMIQNQRGEIVKDLSGRIAKMQPAPAPAPAPKTVEKKVVIGPHREYVVQSGDTLSLIAQAFGTSIGKIKEMNNLKGNSLRVGQKIIVPK